MKKYNYPFLSKKDWIKFPVRNIEEIKQAIEVKNRLKELTNAQFAISPIIEKEAKKGEIKEFIDYLISIKEFDFVVNLQLHKFIDVR